MEEQVPAPEHNGSAALVRAAQTEVTRIIRANRWWKYSAIALSVIIIVLVYLSLQQRIEIRDNCLAGNSFRTGQTKIWDDLFRLSYSNKPPSPHDRALGALFLKDVHTTNAPRACPGVF